jgi:hypothetical protein
VDTSDLATAAHVDLMRDEVRAETPPAARRRRRRKRWDACIQAMALALLFFAGEKEMLG